MTRTFSFRSPGWCTVLFASMTIALPGQTYTTVYNFPPQGGNPQTNLVQATNGMLYGTAPGNDTYYENIGIVFGVTPNGVPTQLFDFCPQLYPCPDGSYPFAGLIQGQSGDLYGTAPSGGITGGTGLGEVFKLSLNGSLTVLHSFCSGIGPPGCPDGEIPNAALVEATNGDFYGTTSAGGLYGTNEYEGGTVFRITRGGKLTTLHSFCAEAGCLDGGSPQTSLIQAANGDFFGTTSEFGAFGEGGTIYTMTPSGSFKTIYSFCAQSGCPDGSVPSALVEASDGNFYGTTVANGAYHGGTVFRITPAGVFTTLYNFCSLPNCADGSQPKAELIQANDGNLYGTTSTFGASPSPGGTIFKITTDGILTTLYSFSSGGIAGYMPYAALLQDTNGDLFGTTMTDPLFGTGTVFSYSLGLPAFVQPQTSSARVGEIVNILGTDLTGATSVSFNGVAATFDVASHSLVQAVVPASATSGTIVVVTPSRTLSSNVPFRVRR